MKGLHIITFILLVVGGLNWGIVGIAGPEWDLVARFLGNGDPTAIIPVVVYILVGLSAVWEIVTHSKNCRRCKKSEMAASPMGGQM